MNTHHCDFDHETSEQLRLLPTSRVEGHANTIICFWHYQREMAFRRRMVADKTWAAEDTDLPEWSTLAVYEG